MIKYCDFRNVKVRYSDSGKGRAIVLIHGFPESLEIWNDFAEPLTGHFRVIAIDLPGFGDTPAIGYVHSMELMAECVKKVMDDIGYRKYVLAGHSMGGYVALAFAELFPKNVSGLCLFHSNAAADSEEKKQDRTRAIEVVKKDARHYVNELVGKLFAPENSEKFREDIERIRAICLRSSKEGIINALAGMRDRKDRQELLKTATFPVQFIIGRKDAVMPAGNLIRQAQLNKNTTLTLLENSGHMGFIEEREKARKALLKFVRKALKKKTTV
ncbi:MAG: alpha/beta hydrolase [Bacteroidota bacterium]